MDYKYIQQYNEGLRPYQIEAKNNIYKAWNSFRSVMFQMPTGTGKTLLFSAIIKDLVNYDPNVRVLILAHRTELIDQISKSIGSKYNIVHGKIKSGYSEEEYYKIQIASVQTLINRLEKRWNKTEFEYIIIDEAHHTLAKSYKKICEYYPNAKILGVTATPYRLNAEPFTSMFETLIISQSIHHFISEGWLSDYKYYSIESDSMTQQRINNLKIGNDGDYSEHDMLSKLDLDEIRANLVHSYKKYADGKKGIIYTIDRTHNIHVCNNFRNAGYKVEVIDSLTPADKRQQIINSFKNNSIDILCNVNIFSEGFDCPEIEFIQLARPTLSLSMFLQQLGRGFRISKNKNNVIFIDNVGLYNRFGLPSINRKWEYYFKGLHKGLSPIFPSETSSIKLENIADDYFEGKEDVKLLYDSHKNNEEIDEIFIYNDSVTDTNINNICLEKTNSNMVEIEELKKTYATLVRKGWDIPEGLLAEIKRYEDSIIENNLLIDIQKILGRQNESNFSSDFSIKLDYKTNDGFSIIYKEKTYKPIISSKNKTYEIVPDKANKRSGRTILKVTFPDGTVIFRRKAKDTFVECVERIGIEKIKNLEIYASGYLLISDKQPDEYQSELLSNGDYLLTQNSTNYKANYLDEISHSLKLDLKIEIVNSHDK